MNKPNEHSIKLAAIYLLLGKSFSLDAPPQVTKALRDWARLVEKAINSSSGTAMSEEVSIGDSAALELVSKQN